MQLTRPFSLKTYIEKKILVSELIDFKANLCFFIGLGYERQIIHLRLSQL